MKRSLYWCVLIVVLVVCMGAYLQTHRQDIVVFRVGVTDATDEPLGSDRKWSSRPATKTYKLPSQWNGIVFYLRGSAENITCVDMEIWGYPSNGTAIHCWTGSITAGAIMHDNGTYHADTAYTIKDSVLGGVKILDGAGDDGVCTIRFDAREVERILVLLPTISTGSWDCDVLGY